MNPAFWQYLAAGRLNAGLAEQIVNEIGSSKEEPISTLLSHRVLTPASRNRMRGTDLKALDRALENGAEILPAHDYPYSLQEAEGMPPAVFVRGSRAALQGPMVAIVGTRNASSYGLAVAQKFAEVLARSGVTIVSGGAFGIDTAAHHGALSAGGQTVAVLGTGVDRVHPAENRELFSRIAEKGCLVSQFACGERGDRASFIQRNEVIAGIAHAVLAVEVPAKSGALKTAGAASDFGREVFVAPGLITMPKFRGSHNLIRNGATLVDSPEQILHALEPILPDRRHHEEDEAQLDGVASQIIGLLRQEPMPLDTLQARTGMEVSELLGELTSLELEGLILQDANGYSLKP